jgi:hypothetical protein
MEVVETTYVMEFKMYCPDPMFLKQFTAFYQKGLKQNGCKFINNNGDKMRILPENIVKVKRVSSKKTTIDNEEMV